MLLVLHHNNPNFFSSRCSLQISLSSVSRVALFTGIIIPLFSFALNGLDKVSSMSLNSSMTVWVLTSLSLTSSALIVFNGTAFPCCKESNKFPSSISKLWSFGKPFLTDELLFGIEIVERRAIPQEVRHVTVI